MNNIRLLYIDLFCGAGGTSTGVEHALYEGDKCAKVIACVNHDAKAIASHKANHPGTLHFTEDIRTLELSPLVLHLEKCRNEYSGGGQLSEIDSPCPAILTTPKQKVVSVRRFLMNPQYSSAGSSVEKPCFTLIARMDKMPPYLIETKTDGMELPNFIIPTEEGYMYCIYETDTSMMKSIKEFMAIYGIVDITMRMLSVPELKRIMGFPENYILVGTQADQKKFIGNAVEVTTAKVLCEVLVSSLMRRRRKETA